MCYIESTLVLNYSYELLFCYKKDYEYLSSNLFITCHNSNSHSSELIKRLKY